MNGAIFISYAHEDTDTARRIAEALRTAGLEVWFDQNELRGGDAWDQKIRRQIEDCTLFIPIVSAATEGRPKGYFRLEWKLAVEQAHLMAEGVPFLTPVVVDDTAEKTALVPAEFRKVQWTRLPGGEPTPAFVSQVQRLLAHRRTPPAAAPQPPAPAANAAAASASPVTSAQSQTPRWSRFLFGGLATVVVAAGWTFLRPSAPVGLTSPNAAPPAPPATAPAADATAAAEKRVAVLGFSYLSGDRSKEFYAEAVREVLITSLGKIPKLQVISYASNVRDIADTEVARRANAGYLVKGAVLALDDRIRITARLVRGSDGVELWSDNFTREMRDFIAVQDQIASLVADALSLKLGTRPATPPVNPAAFQLYLEGRQEWNKRTTEGFDLAQQKFEQAIALEPKFARAYTGLADTWYLRNGDITSADPGTARAENVAEAERLAQARAYVEKALSLDDSLAEAHASLGQILRDPPAKEAAFRRALELNPSYASARHWYGMFLMGQGRLGEGVTQLATAERLDPLSHRIASGHALVLVHLRRWTEALAAAERAHALEPSFASTQQHRAHALLGLGRTRDALPIARDLAERSSSGIALLALAGDRESAARLARRLFENPGRVPAGRQFEIYAALNWGEEGFRFLEKEGNRLTARGYLLYTEMTFDSVRQDPRFEAALARFDLLERYRAAWAAIEGRRTSSAGR